MIRHPSVAPRAAAASDASRRSPISRPRTTPRNVLLDADSSSGYPRSASWSEARSRVSDCSAVLPRSRPASSTIRSGVRPAAGGPVRPLEQERPDRLDHVVVDRVGVGDAGPQADVGGHHRGPGGGRHRQVLGVGEATDVVAHHRPDGVGLLGHRGPPGVDRQRDVEPGPQGLEGRDDPVELLGLVDRRARAGLHPAHVEQVGAVVRPAARPGAPGRRGRRWPPCRRRSRGSG